MTKIDIISGFLGAGKTTLIKKLLQGAFKNEKVVLIENEYGEIGIDGGFLKDAGIEIKEMNSGCICCSLVGDFAKSLKEVVDKYAPDRIIIEPSGVGKLSDVIRAVENAEADLKGAEINTFCAVVDATKAKVYMKNFGEFFNNQIESAKTIILSRTQNVSDEKLQEVVALLREHNANAAIITTPWDELDNSTVLAAMEKKTSFEQELLEEMKHAHEDEDEDEHEHHHHHHHDEDEDEHEHHHHDDDEDEDEHEHHHHHHDDDEDEHEHHHHHHEDGEECHCGCGHHHHHHHADEVFTSWGHETPRKYTHDELDKALKALANTDEYGTILRAKGMVESTDGTWMHFDLTPEEYEIRKGAADYTGRLCVIGQNLKEEDIEKLFNL